MSRRGVTVGALVGLLVAPVAGQADLDQAVARAREAWAGHDARALVSSSDTIRLRIPEVMAAQALRPAQAARILATYLAEAEEVALELREVRYVAEDHAYAELARRYVVRGTEERRDQAVFFGFRRVDGVWRLREVRITP